MEPGQSAFLHSLGWATLNSFWQFGLLWCLYLLANQFLRLSSHQKYSLAVTSIVTGFLWFTITFFVYFFSGKAENFALVEMRLTDSSQVLNVVLTTASVTYLCLLSIPSYKLWQNWKYVARLRKNGLHKASYSYRLFVQKIGKHLGIKKPVHLYISDLVQSPLTIGFFKPIILLPVAAVNNLNTQQAEAILLHELSHIRRYDYLVNILVAVIHTLLYFNPFVKRLMNAIEAERENCCDEMVLQFEYDKVSYASALLTLEKQAAQHQLLAIAANGKNTLLHRIERIVGMQKKSTFNITHLVGVAASLILIFVINSFIISGKEKLTLQMEGFNSPLAMFSSDHYNAQAVQEKMINDNRTVNLVASANNMKERKATISFSIRDEAQVKEQPVSPQTPTSPDNSAFVHVGYDAVDGSLTTEQKEKVKNTVEATKKVLRSEWSEVEKTIPDGLSAQEKQMAQQEYYANLEKLDWKNIELNIKAQINTIDLDKINESLNAAIVKAKVDSVQAVYSKILVEIEKTQDAAKCKALPMPDASKQQVEKAKAELQSKIQLLETVKAKKVIKL